MRLGLQVVVKEGFGTKSLDVPLMEILVGKQADQVPVFIGVVGKRQSLASSMFGNSCARAPSAGVGQVEHGGVFGPIWDTKEGVMFLCDALRVIDECFEPSFIGWWPPLSHHFRWWTRPEIEYVMVGLGFTSMMLSNIMSRPSVEKCHRFPDASVSSLDSRCS